MLLKILLIYLIIGTGWALAANKGAVQVQVDHNFYVNSKKLLASLLVTILIWPIIIVGGIKLAIKAIKEDNADEIVELCKTLEDEEGLD